MLLKLRRAILPPAQATAERMILGAQRFRNPLAISSSTSAIRSTGGPLRLLAFGDMALLPEGRPSVGGWPALLGGLEALLESADIRIANLESVLTVRTTPSGSIGGFLRADPEAVGALTNAGMDVVTCANNHCLDFGPEALAESVETLRQSGIASCGVAIGSKPPDPAIIERHGTTVAVLGFCDDHFIDPACIAEVQPAHTVDGAMAAAVRNARSIADVVVVNLHWGYEWALHPLKSQRDRARAVADAGAQVVLCHHAHVPMAVERYGESIIAHGLGNCFFPWRESPPHPWRNDSFALSIEVTGGVVRSAAAHPIHIRPDQRVGLASGRRSASMLGGLARLGRHLGDDAWLQDVEDARMAREGVATIRALRTASSQGCKRVFQERCAWLRSPRQQRLRDSIRQMEAHPILTETIDSLSSPDITPDELSAAERTLSSDAVDAALIPLTREDSSRVSFMERIP